MSSTKSILTVTPVLMDQDQSSTTPVVSVYMRMMMPLMVMSTTSTMKYIKYTEPVIHPSVKSSSPCKVKMHGAPILTICSLCKTNYVWIHKTLIQDTLRIQQQYLDSQEIWHSDTSCSQETMVSRFMRWRYKKPSERWQTLLLDRVMEKTSHSLQWNHHQ